MIMIQVETGTPLKELKEEIRTLRKCDSPHIVAYKGTFQKNNEIWIVMVLYFLSLEQLLDF